MVGRGRARGTEVQVLNTGKQSATSKTPGLSAGKYNITVTQEGHPSASLMEGLVVKGAENEESAGAGGYPETEPTYGDAIGKKHGSDFGPLSEFSKRLKNFYLTAGGVDKMFATCEVHRWAGRAESWKSLWFQDLRSSGESGDVLRANRGNHPRIVRWSHWVKPACS